MRQFMQQNNDDIRQDDGEHTQPTADQAEFLRKKETRVKRPAQKNDDQQ